MRTGDTFIILTDVFIEFLRHGLCQEDYLTLNSIQNLLFDIKRNLI